MKLDFEIHLLDKNENFKRVLKNVNFNGSVSVNSLATIKRIANIQIVNDLDIDYLSDRIKIYALLDGDGLFPSETLIPSETLFPLSGVAKYALGVYLLSAPETSTQGGVTTIDVTCYEKTEILKSERLTDRLILESGSKYTDAIFNLITSSGINKINITSSDAVMEFGEEIDFLTTKLDAINFLLDKINYNSLYTDNEGVVIVEPYTLPTSKPITYNYTLDEDSIIIDDGFTEELDLFNTPNQWVGISSVPEQTLKSIYENNNLDSKTSIPNRGRIITAEPLYFDYVPTQSILDDLVAKVANQSTKYARIEFNSVINPVHGYLDRLKVNETDFIETSWTINFDGSMSHRCRRVVSV